jgi:hypothetical protein
MPEFSARRSRRKFGRTLAAFHAKRAFALSCAVAVA